MTQIDSEKCIGCGLCTSICEEAFKMGKDGKAQVVSKEKLPCVDEAIESCPVNAISK